MPNILVSCRITTAKKLQGSLIERKEINILKNARTYQATLFSDHNVLRETAFLEVSHAGRPEFIIFDGRLYQNRNGRSCYYLIPSCVVAPTVALVFPSPVTVKDRVDYVPSPEKAFPVTRHDETVTAERLEQDVIVRAGENARSFSEWGNAGDLLVTDKSRERRVYTPQQFAAIYKPLTKD